MKRAFSMSPYDLIGSLLAGAVLIVSALILTPAVSAQGAVDQADSQNPNQMRVPARDALSTEGDLHTTRRQNAKTLDGLRNIDGFGNNLSRPTWGQADQTFLRLVPSDYADGKATLSGPNRASPRVISNAVIRTRGKHAPIGSPVSDMFWQWGQFLDHDLTLTPEIEPIERADIAIPKADPWFDRNAAGNKAMPFSRSSFSKDINGTRQQHNFITAYIDASNVYGSDAIRAKALRTNDGTGRLRVSRGNLLPFNTSRLPNAPSTSNSFFIAGDFRANEQIGLTALHTLFVREHNRIAAELRANNSALSGEDIYQQTRALIGALMQVITYQEFLPALLGRSAFAPYQGYRSDVNASISNEFSTAAFRVGHTMLSSQLLRLDASGEEASEGSVRLRDAFFKPQEITRHGIESILRGLATQRAQKIDVQLVDDVRNLLFGDPAAGGLDLAALNIQRGRDHGIASYTDTRTSLGLSPMLAFTDVTSDPVVQNQLQSVYGNVQDIDLWVGGLAEPALAGAMIGETFHKIVSDQFRRLRDGDRFWYANHLSASDIQWVERQTLAQVIRRNTTINNEISDNVFRVNAGAPLGHIILLLLD